MRSSTALPDDFDETLDASTDPSARGQRLPVDPVKMPIYRPRRQTSRRFWMAFVLALVLVAVAALVIVAWA
jgi:hypothetical protein